MLYVVKIKSFYVPFGGGWVGVVYNRHMSFNRIAMVARWKPLHWGQAAVLRALCRGAGQVLIGVGSSNRYNVRNPFTFEETESMLRLTLAGFDTAETNTPPTQPAENYEIMPVPDLDDGPRWRVMVKELFGELDAFVTDNPYVANLMKDDYRLMRPVDWLDPLEHLRIDGTTVRVLMAKGQGWQDWVPERVAQYIQENQLDERFRREFGLETLAMQSVIKS
jgi:nicotinamide-nucleotide adenylyltransferase